MQPPQKPDNTDCCNSGCVPCIFDIYDQQLKLYEEYLKSPQTESRENYTNCLSLTSYSIFKLINIKKFNSDTSAYIFEYVDNSLDKYKLVYKPGQHFLLKNVIIEDSQEKSTENEILTRAYTPIPFGDEKHTSFTVLIKIYKHGKMSKFIRNLEIGSLTKWRGPYGNFEVKYSFKNILCISQGTGIAPIYSVIRKLLDNEECESRINLYACYKNLEEFLLRSEINSMKSYWNFLATIFLPYEDDNLQSKLLYNEKIHCRRLGEHDVENYFNCDFMDKNTQVLICGSQIFVDTVTKIVKKYDGIDLFVF